MGAREFGLWVDHEMRERHIGAAKLARRVGELPDGTGLDATGVRLIRQGKRIKYDTELVRRIAVALGLDEDEAYWIAGVWPAPLDLESYRRFRHLAAATSNGVTAKIVAIPLPAELEDADLLRRLGVPDLERRRADRRRRLRVAA